MLPLHSRAERRAGHAEAFLVRPEVYVGLYAEAGADVLAILALDAALAGLLALDGLGRPAVLDEFLGAVDAPREELRERLALVAVLPADVLLVLQVHRLGVGLPPEQLVEALLGLVECYLKVLRLAELAQLLDCVQDVLRVVVEPRRAEDEPLPDALAAESDAPAEVAHVRHARVADEPRHGVFGPESPLSVVPSANHDPLVVRRDLEVVDVELRPLDLRVDDGLVLLRAPHDDPVLDTFRALPGKANRLRPVCLAGLLLARHLLGGKPHLLLAERIGRELLAALCRGKR